MLVNPPSPKRILPSILLPFFLPNVFKEQMSFVKVLNQLRTDVQLNFLEKVLPARRFAKKALLLILPPTLKDGNLKFA